MSNIFISEFLNNVISRIENTYLYYEITLGEENKIKPEYETIKKYILERIKEHTDKQINDISNKKNNNKNKSDNQFVSSVMLINKFDN